MIYNIHSYGAVPGEGTMNTRAIQSAIDACHEAGGGRVYCPAGTYPTGTLHLKSNVELHLAFGCDLVGSQDRADYESSGAPYDQGSKGEFASGTHLICAWQQENVALTGLGTVSGNGPRFLGPEQTQPWRWDYKERWRPGQMVAFLECRNVVVENVTLRDAAYWTLWPYACDRVRIRGIRIVNDWRTPNGDGIDPDCCEDVVISDCQIQAGDDAIALRANQAKAGIEKPLENVVIQNCILSTRYAGIRFGPSGDQSAIRNVAVSNCVIKEATKGVLFSQWYRPPRWDHGVLVENVTVSNLVINAFSPLRMYVQGECRRPGGFRNIAFQDILATGYNTCNFQGNDKAVFEDIRFRHVHLTLSKRDMIEIPHGGFPEEHKDYGFYFERVDRLKMDDVTLECDADVGKKFRAAFRLDNVRDATLERIDLRRSALSPNFRTTRCTGIRRHDIRYKETS